MTKEEADILKDNLNQVLSYINRVIILQITAIKNDIDNLTKEE